MNLIIFAHCIVLFCYTSAGIKGDSIPIDLNELDNISIKAALSANLETDINEKIERRFLNIINEFSTTCTSYKYDLNTRNYSFPKKEIRTQVVGDRVILFNNFTISDWNDNSKGYYIGYSTQLDCDSTSTIEVALPSNIQISASVQLTHQSNTSIEEGSVSIVLKNALIRYPFVTLPDENSASKIFYNTSETRVKIDSKLQTIIYSKLDVFLSEIESALSEFFLQQLREKMNKANVSLTNACSKLTDLKDSLDSRNSLILNTTSNDLYFISNASQKTWNNVIINGGPILIQGLSDFNSTQFVIYESHNNDEQYVDGHKYDSIHKKELIVGIKTNSLKGKLEWNYYFKQNDNETNPINFTFFIDQIQFRYSYFIHKYIRDQQVYIGNPTFPTLFKNYINVNVSVGKIQTKILPSSSCENTFVEIFVKKYFKSVLSEYIKNAIVQQISKKPSYSNCVYTG